MKTKPNKTLLQVKSRLRAGFSLIELLVVIAIIGIIAAIAIPNIAGLTDGAGDAKNERNAQSIASAFSSARAVGWDPPAAVVDAPTAIDEIVSATGAVGPGGEVFRVPMNAAEVTELKAYVATNTTLTYVAATDQLEYTP